MIATITLAEGVPGLFNVELADGREFRDLTLGQLHSLRRQLGLTLLWPKPTTEGAP